MNRPPLSQATLSQLPFSFDGSYKSVAFVIGVANSTWPHPSGIAYKAVKWKRYDLREGLPIPKQKVENFISRAVADLKLNTKKNIHTIAIFRLINGEWKLECGHEKLASKKSKIGGETKPQGHLWFI